METTNKLFYSGTKFFTENEEDYRITVRISLDDDCKNNICDWSITADVDWKNKHGKYEDYLGGCCHDEVAKHFPELAKFISLHLCNHYGAPMYPVENGIYHVRRSGMSVAMEYLRISEQEYAIPLFKAGAEWRINSVWHSITVIPDCHRFIVFLPKKSTIGSKNPIMGILEENKTFISSRPGCILCRLDEMESWAYLDDLLP